MNVDIMVFSVIVVTHIYVKAEDRREDCDMKPIRLDVAECFEHREQGFRGVPAGYNIHVRRSEHPRHIKV